MREERERGRRGRGGERSERGFFFCFGSDDFFSLSFASLVALSLFQGPDRRARDRTTPEPTREAKALLGTWSPLLFLSHSLFNQFSPWRASPRRPLPPRAPCFSPTPGRIASLPRRPGRRCSRFRRGTAAAAATEGAEVDAGPQHPLERLHGCKLARRVVVAASMVRCGEEKLAVRVSNKE